MDFIQQRWDILIFQAFSGTFESISGVCKFTQLRAHAPGMRQGSVLSLLRFTGPVAPVSLRSPLRFLLLYE